MKELSFQPPRTARRKTALHWSGAAIPIAAVLSLVGCSGNEKDVAPPHATDKVNFEPQSSDISVPVHTNLMPLQAALEREVPRTLWTIDQPGVTCLASKRIKILLVKVKTPTIKCRIVGQVTRGRLQLSGSGRNFIVTLPLHAVIHARDIGGVLKQETATADARVRTIMKLDLRDDWSLTGKTTIAYDWTNPPAVDFLGQHIELTSTADAKLKGVLARLEKALPRELAKVHLRAAVERGWHGAFTSVSLNDKNPPVWMRITPQSLDYGGYSVSGQRAVLHLGMKAITETFVGERPPDPAPTALPKVGKLDEKPGQLRFFIPVIADYPELEPVIGKALVKRQSKPFEVPGIGAVNARFGKVVAYGTNGGRIAVGLTFSATDAANRLGESKGTLWLTAVPVNQPDSRVVAFKNFEVQGVTNGIATKLLIRLANTSSFSATITDALTQNFSNDYDKLLGKIARAIDEKRVGNIVIRGKLEQVHTGVLKATGEGVFLPVRGTGVATIELDTD